MTIQTRAYLGGQFSTGDRPTQTDFADLIDSFVSMGIGDTNTGSLTFSGCLSITGSISGSVAQFSSSVLVTGSLIAANGASVGGSLFANIIRIQGAGTNASRIAFMDANINHGMTTLVDPTQFGSINRWATCGGIQIVGYTASTVAFNQAALAGIPDSTRSTAALGYYVFGANAKSGTGQAAPGDNENLYVFRTWTNARFIFDSDGDFHADAAINASSYDVHDDIGMVRSLEVERVKQVMPSVGLREEFGQWARYNKDELEHLKVATFNDGRPGRDNDGSVFINYTALARLHSGAIWQLAQRLGGIEEQLQLSGCNYLPFLTSGCIT